MGGCGSTSAIKIPHEKRYRRAIKLYQVTEVKSLTNLLNRNKCFESGESPLTLAAQEGHEAVVQSLVASGADVNKLDNNGRGPLHIAVQLNDEETAEILLAANANPNKYDSGNATPLHLAAENGNVSLVRRLLKAGASVNECQRGVAPLVLAVSHGHADCVQVLLEHGAEPNALDGRGNSALHVAVRQKDAACTRLLLEYKASVQSPGHDDTPLVCLACLTGCHETLKLLVELAGCPVDIGGRSDDADVDADEELPPPIIAATVVGNADCIDVLLAAGADPNTADKRGYRALQIAVMSVVDASKESFYGKYFANLYRRYSRYDVGEVSHENSTRCAMSLVTGGADADLVWRQFAALFPSPEGISFEQMVLCEVLIQCYGFRGVPSQLLAEFVDKLLALREYGLLKLLYSAGVDPTWNDESRVGISAEDGDREMFRWIKRLRTNARSLRDLCRRRIRRLLSWNVLYLVHRLPVLSEEMKEYVCIMDTDHYSVNADDLQHQTDNNHQTTSAPRADDAASAPADATEMPSQNGDVNASTSEFIGEEVFGDCTQPEQTTPPLNELSAEQTDGCAVQTTNEQLDNDGDVGHDNDEHDDDDDDDADVDDDQILQEDVVDNDTIANGGASPTPVAAKETGSATNGEVRNLLEGRTPINEKIVDDFHRALAT